MPLEIDLVLKTKGCEIAAVRPGLQILPLQNFYEKAQKDAGELEQTQEQSDLSIRKESPDVQIRFAETSLLFASLSVWGTTPLASARVSCSCPRAFGG
jgi:hypothetical protein